MNGKISNWMQVASTRRYTLTEGRGKGLDVIDCDNGKLRFLLNVSKALDVMQLYHEGQNMSFLSKNAFTGREVDFLKRFEGGMVYTCGLDSVGGREGFPLHGSLHNIPAEVIECTCDEAGIKVVAIVRDTALFGQNLVLKRTVTSAVGSESVQITDELTNAGFADANYCLLYHINVGYPMLDEGAKLLADVVSCVPRTPWSAQNENERECMVDSVVCEEETCYFLKLKTPKASLVNEKLGKTFSVEYSADTLPHFVQWRSMASGDYALGLEPCTTELDDQFAYKTIKAGESVQFCVRLSVTQ